MPYFGTTLGSPPGLPGGRMTGIVPTAGGRITGVDPAVGGGLTTPVSGTALLSGTGNARSPPAPGGTVGASRSGTTGTCAQAGIVASNPAASAAQSHHGPGSGRRRCSAIARAPRPFDCPRIPISRSNHRPKRPQSQPCPRRAGSPNTSLLRHRPSTGRQHR